MPRICWAAARGDCKGKISGEHVFSPKLHPDGTIRAYGAAREVLRRARAAPTDLKAKVLCEYHNNSLGELDDEAIALQDALRVRLRSEHPEEMHVYVDGWRMERWVMKCTCGVFAAGWTQPQLTSSQRRGLVAGKEILDVIYGDKQLPVGFGLHVVIDPPATLYSATSHVRWASITGGRAGTEVVGLLVELTGVGMIVRSTPHDLEAGLRRLPAPDAADENAIDWRRARLSARPPRVAFETKRAAWRRRGRLVIHFKW